MSNATLLKAAGEYQTLATFDELSIGIRGLLDVEVGVGFMIE